MELLTQAATVTAGAGLVAGGYLYASLWPTSKIFGKTLSSSRHPDEVALTYDDGPSPVHTPALLDVLEKYNTKATFFLMGEHVQRHPQLARRVAAAGHTIGNHTYTHPKLMFCSAARAQRELELCQQIIFDTTGVTPRVFRPPFGGRRPVVLRLARAMGLEPVTWNVTAKDWQPIDAQRILANMDADIQRNRAKGVGSNILLHDASHLDGPSATASRAASVQATEALLQRKGWKFVAL